MSASRATLVAAIFLASCGSRDAPIRSFDYRFALAPTNAREGTFGPGTDIEYAFHRGGRCTPTGPNGDPFVPHKGGKAALESLGNQTVTIFLADVEAVTVGIVVRGERGTLVASGCAQATLDAASIVPIEIPLQYPDAT